MGEGKKEKEKENEKLKFKLKWRLDRKIMSNVILWEIYV